MFFCGWKIVFFYHGSYNCLAVKAEQAAAASASSTTAGSPSVGGPPRRGRILRGPIPTGNRTFL